MSVRRISNVKKDIRSQTSISAIAVEGYKSIAKKSRIEIRPLTILAGANSSGKSSIVQPLLLLKQTLESAYDPGPLLLNGRNVKFTSTDQILSRVSEKKMVDGITIGYEFETIKRSTESVSITFKRVKGKGFEIIEMTHTSHGNPITIRPDMKDTELKRIFPEAMTSIPQKIEEKGATVIRSEWQVERNYCFLDATYYSTLDTGERIPVTSWLGSSSDRNLLTDIIHVPGLRGNPERRYPKTAAGANYPGTFDPYTASLIDLWQEENEKNLNDLKKALKKVGLTRSIKAVPIGDAEIELQVGRLPPNTRNSANDFVDIADVGFGVSTSLPVLVALLACEPGRTVYIEEPELHLHPRAQVSLAEILAEAAQRGVKVVAETHSSLLLLGIKTLVAEGKLDPGLVKLHWFQRDKDGSTKITSTDLDKSGAFDQDWPLDFDDVELKAHGRYLNAGTKK